ncbi:MULTISPECIES: glutamate racemase [Thermus]|uniref:Glutamate racemase n=1 Tax=Thermus brockianus TaxID=56956 RepID=A0A1J0LSX3_THEBO|nr:glutamate racemase [Thermus brockianus]APD09186.1 glutamate racemase [Thermus brockianus]
MKDPKAPIGVFDSGVGGLTVLKALRHALPREDFLYFGDTARVPYGGKPLPMVRRFAWEIAGFLLRQGVKALVVACNTASSAALPDLAEDLSVPVFGVLEPAAEVARGYRKVGLIGTQATVESGAYGRYVPLAWAKACPLFVPLVEEGLWDDPVALLVARHYLEEAPKDLEALILGCTHYPFLKGTLEKVLPGVKLIDSAEATARKVAEALRQAGLLNPEGQGKVVHYVTGDPESYKALAERLGERVETLYRVSLEEL